MKKTAFSPLSAAGGFESYVPEAAAFADKGLCEARAFCEDCALLDTANGYRTVAFRGRDPGLGESFFQHMALPAEEIGFLERALAENRRTLLRGARGAVLIFPELLQATGLLLAVCPHAEPEAFFRALLYMGRQEICFSPSYQACRTAHSAADEQVFAAASSLFFSLDRILSNDTKALPIKCRLIASFAGYRPAAAAEPLRALSTPSTADSARLVAFWLCVFLTLRRQNGSLTAERQAPAFSDTETLCRIEITDLPEQAHKPKKALPRFWELPAFRDFSVAEENGHIVLEAAFRDPRKSPLALFSPHAAPQHTLRITLSFSAEADGAP